MDREKYKTLERLFRYLVKSPVVSNQLEEYQQIQAWKSEYIEMGLDIEFTSSSLKLNHKIEPIYVDKLSKNLLNYGIHKPIIYCFSTPSTNALAKAGKQQAIYIAEYQSLGQGRQTKHWISPLGQSIILSINHTFDFGLDKIAGLNTAIGVALINTANSFGNLTCGLKWPNDVISKVGKIGGILIEATGDTKQCRVTIGVGINWLVRQDLFNAIPQKCDNIFVGDCSKTEFMSRLIIEIEKIITEFNKNKLLNILPKWQDFDILSNHKIHVFDKNKTYKATYLNVNQQGMLSIKHNNKVKIIASGEVSIRKVD